MGGERLRKYWSNDINALLETYKQFEVLIPAKSGSGSAHNGEDGRYVENMLKSYIKKYLPKELEILTGFILRPGVICGKSDKSRAKDDDQHSKQLDLIIYDTAHFPIFQRIDDNAIVPPEGVIAIISLKKHLRSEDIKYELPKLKEAVNLCKQYDINNDLIKKPMTALISMKTDLKDMKSIFNVLHSEYKDTYAYDEMITYIGSIYDWTIYKKSIIDAGENYAQYRVFSHDINNIGRGFQYLLKKIMDTYYDNQRSNYKQPGYVALNSYTGSDKMIGQIRYVKKTM